jgi:hypothetical protein
MQARLDRYIVGAFLDTQCQGDANKGGGLFGGVPTGY